MNGNRKATGRAGRFGASIRRIVCLALAVMCAAVMTACGGKSGQTADNGDFSPRLSTDEEVTLNIIGSMLNFESLEAVISDFEQYYPNCSVLYSGPLEVSYRDTLEERLRSDDSIGIFMIDNKLYDNEYISSICADLQKEDIDFSAISQHVISASIAGGKMYEIPLALDASGLVVNVDLLKKEGLDIPQNKREFLETCKTLKQKGYTPITGYDKTMFQRLIDGMAYIALEEVHQDEESKERLLSGEEGSADALLPALETLQELRDLGFIDRETNLTYEDGYNDTILQFFEGDVPFLAASTETFSGMKKRETKSEFYSEHPFSYQFMFVPIAENGAYGYIKNWQGGFAVNENCSDKQWAVEFIRFLVTRDEINKLASIKGLPSVAIQSDDERFANLYDIPEENLCRNAFYISAAIEEGLYRAEEAVYLGETDAEGALDIMEEYLRSENGGK